MVTPRESPDGDKRQDLTAEGYVGQIKLQALLGWRTNDEAEAKEEWESHLKKGGSDFAMWSRNWRVAHRANTGPNQGETLKTLSGTNTSLPFRRELLPQACVNRHIRLKGGVEDSVLGGVLCNQAA